MNRKIMDEYRKHIDDIDNKLLALFAKRFEIVKKIGIYKKKNGLTIIDKQRENEKIKKLINKSKTSSVTESFIKQIWTIIFNQSYVIEQ